MGPISSPFNLSRLLQASALVLSGVAAPYSLAGPGEPSAAAGVSLSVASPTVPPGGMLQLQISVTEPKPILKGKQGMRYASVASAAGSTLGEIGAPAASPLGTIRDAALFSPKGDVAGVLVSGAGRAQIFFTSPMTSFGTSLDTPVIAIGIPVTKGAAVGQTVKLTLDPNSSLWYDPNSSLYPVELKSGVLTVGGTLSISDVSPGSGIVQPGAVISIRGVGFQPTSEVDVNEGKIATSQYINANLIRVTLAHALNIRGTRIRIKNDNNERAEYYAYRRTTPLGKSTHALVAASFPLFSQSTRTQGYFRPTLHGTMFSGLALQNVGTAQATVILQLTSKSGATLSKQTVLLGKNSNIARDLGEFFPGVVPASGTRLSVTSDQRIQMLGLLGDDATSTLLPVNPTSTP